VVERDRKRTCVLRNAECRHLSHLFTKEQRLFFYLFVYGCMLCIIFFNSASYVLLLLLLLLRLCILIDVCALFCIFLANWHSPATVTEVFPCFFLSCKTNARVYLAKTGHGPHSYQLVKCVDLCIVCVDCVVLCIVCV